jgi:hypothetical protein
MSIKLAVLKSGEKIISDIKELISNEKPCGYLFYKPHVVGVRTPILLTEENSNLNEDLEVIMSPWINLTSDEKITVPLEWVVTIVEPIKIITQLYQEKINDKDNQVSFTEE